MAIRLLLTLALLLSQIAIIAHDVHCLDGDHDAMCEVYFAQDHSANSDARQSQLEHRAGIKKPDSFTLLNTSTSLVPSYLSRAPPTRL